MSHHPPPTHPHHTTNVPPPHAPPSQGPAKLGGLQAQELQVEAKLSLYGAMKELYDREQQGKSVKQLARKPAMSYVKQVGQLTGWQ